MENLPLYKKVGDALKKDILSGVYQEGDILPSENELCAIFGTTRMTVRQALGPLVNEGYIIKKKGKGSVVASRKNSLGLLSFRGFSDVLGKTEHRAGSQIIDGPSCREWPVPFFYGLSEEEENAGCIFFNRVRAVDKEPVMLEYTFLPNFGLGGLCKAPLLDNSLFKTLAASYQIEMRSLEQEIRAVRAEEEIAVKLKLDEGLPLLHIYRKYTTSRKGTYIYSSLYCNTEKYAIGSEEEQ